MMFSSADEIDDDEKEGQYRAISLRNH